MTIDRTRNTYPVESIENTWAGIASVFANSTGGSMIGSPDSDYSTVDFRSEYNSYPVADVITSIETPNGMVYSFDVDYKAKLRELIQNLFIKNEPIR